MAKFKKMIIRKEVFNYSILIYAIITFSLLLATRFALVHMDDASSIFIIFLLTFLSLFMFSKYDLEKVFITREEVLEVKLNDK
jgi:hypothetical protein